MFLLTHGQRSMDSRSGTDHFEEREHQIRRLLRYWKCCQQPGEELWAMKMVELPQ